MLLTTLIIILKLWQIMASYCEDWTLCQRVRCVAFPDPCPKDKPYLLYGECGCCQFCSEKPRVGPCGTCGKDVICKEPYPICYGDNQTVTIDHCGCCRVCKTIVGIGSKCGSCSSTVCAAGLKCVNGTCVKLANN